MKANCNSQTPTGQVNSSESSPARILFTRDQLLEIDRRNKERARLAALQETGVPIPKGCSTANALDKRYKRLPPVAKMILNILDARSEKWSANPFSQQWLAHDIGCSLRWVRYCIALLKKLGFIAIIPINRGKPFKTKNGFWTYPNIYIVTPFLRWAQSAKMYDRIVAQAEKIRNDFLQLSNMIYKYIKRENKSSNSSQQAKTTVGNILKKKCPWYNNDSKSPPFIKIMTC